MIDWNLAAQVVTALGGIITAAGVIGAGVTWLVERRRQARRAATHECLRDLSVEGRLLLNHIHARSLAFAEHERRCPTNEPNNTNEKSIATGAALKALDEHSLMAVMQIEPASTFYALVQDLQRRGLIDVETDDVFYATHLFISDLGLAVLSPRLPRELQPAAA